MDNAMNRELAKKLKPTTIVAQATMQATVEALEWIKDAVELPGQMGVVDVVDIANKAMGVRWVCVRIPIEKED